MQAEYPKKVPPVHWDTLNIEYPTRKFPETEVSGETIGRQWRNPGEVLKDLRTPIKEIKEYNRDFNVTNELMRSITALDYGFKHPETKRHYKHSALIENHYIYPPSRKLEHHPPLTNAHGTTEMRSAFTVPTIAPRLVTNKDQFKHQLSLPEPKVKPSWHKELEPLDTTYEGFEKLLDPYLTTSRLNHRPYTAEQLGRLSNNNDNITFYTYANIPWVRRAKPETEMKLPRSLPKSMYDRQVFKQDTREIITHNKLKWAPGSFRTEVRDNFAPKMFQLEDEIDNCSEYVRSSYQRAIACLPTNNAVEDASITRTYSTENSHVGSGRPICTVLDQFVEKNKRLELRSQ